MRNLSANAFPMRVANLHKTDIRERSYSRTSNLQISPRAELQIQKELFALSIPQVTSRKSFAEFHSRCRSTIDTWGENKWNIDEHASSWRKATVLCSRECEEISIRGGIYDEISVSCRKYVYLSLNRRDVNVFM